MADSNNPGQFGNRPDTEEQARKGGQASSVSSEQAREAGKQSHKRGRRSNKSSE